MPKSWATSGVDLHLNLTGPHVRASLEQALREAVRSGRLAPGTQLPSSRALAGDLRVARNTIADAYGQLVAEGWLVARQGSGTRVADRVNDIQAATSQPAASEGGRPRHDLQPGAPDLSAFPRTAWLTAARRALASAPAEALGYTDPRGRPELREALAGYLARVRGVHTSPDRIMVCSGFTQGLSLLCRVLHARGATTLASEAYGLTDNRDAATTAGLQWQPLPVDNDGAIIDQAGGAAAILLTPAHQFPLGVILASTRRSQAIRWAADTGGLVIEDDYDGEFRYDRQPVGALQALAPEHVVYAGTASKTLAPGLRLGWLALPTQLVDDVIEVKKLADRHTGVLDQLTLAKLITSGGYDRQIRRQRLAYRRRRDRLISAMHGQLPGVRISGIAAGLHALLELPAGLQEEDIIARAARHGVHVAGLSAYSLAQQHCPPALVVGYATPPEHAFTAALARLRAVLDEAAHCRTGT